MEAGDTLQVKEGVDQETIDAVREVSTYKYGWNTDIEMEYAPKGLNEDIVKLISEKNNEPEWMTEIRIKAYRHFMERKMPDWGNCSELNNINFDNVTYFLRSSDATEKNWDDVPDDIKNTFDRLGIPEAEQKWLGGVTAQYESEAVYHSIREDLEDQGVLFLDMDSGLKEHPEIDPSIIPPYVKVCSSALLPNQGCPYLTQLS